MLIPILLGAGILTRQQLDEATELAHNKELSLEQALVESGVAKQSRITASTEALEKVEQKKITLDVAIRAVRVSVQKDITLNEALQSISRHSPPPLTVRASNELTQILVAADLISGEEMEKAVTDAKDSSMMIGQWLVLQGTIKIDNLQNALNAVLMIRAHGLDEGKAAKAVKHANKRSVTFEQALFENGDFIHPDSRIIRLGELFDMAGLISNADLAECFEIELFENRDFGRIMLERKLATEEQIDSGKTLLGSISGGTLVAYQAAEALRQVCLEARDVYATIATYQLLHKADSNDRLGELLIGAQALTDEQLEKALKVGKDESIKLGVALLKADVVSEPILYSALRLQTLIRFGYIARARAIELLKYCYQKEAKLEKAFSELGVNVPSRMQWTWV